MIFDPEKPRPSRPSPDELALNAAGAWWMAHMPIDMISRWLGICEDDASAMRVWAQVDLRTIKGVEQ